ncbi:MAG: hypothetical protein K2G51_02710, partial [Lachnospiraceae bacterium]|nr:hypothetical protein [Lachnospiraceae bacterium]
MQMIVDWIFTFLDMISLTFCSAYLVFLLPRMKESAGNKKILRVVKGMAWMIYTLLAVMIPMIWRNDSITMLGLTAYYILVGYVLYHRDKFGILYQVGFMFSLYATQVISIFTAVMVREVYALENRTSAYIMILLKACLLVMVTFV